MRLETNSLFLLLLLLSLEVEVTLSLEASSRGQLTPKDSFKQNPKTSYGGFRELIKHNPIAVGVSALFEVNRLTGYYKIRAPMQKMNENTFVYIV